MSEKNVDGGQSSQQSRQSSKGTLYNSPSATYAVSQYIESDELRAVSEAAQDTWDEIGSEASEHARIWHVYNDVATKVDHSNNEGCNRGIDGLLVFTGLFSAVLTTFIIQSYQQMLPSPSDTTNALLLQIISLQAAALNRTDAIVGASSSILSTEPIPSTSDLHWVNGLWFAALSCSLSAALVSMLSKQWIQSTPNNSGSARYRARQRQQRYMQFRNWHVFAVINALPLLLHVALLLFFAGLIVLLWSGDIAITAATFTIVALAYTFYIGSMWMSLIYPDCPYQHPVSEQLRRWAFGQRPFSGPPAPLTDLENAVERGFQSSMRIQMTPAVVNPEDDLDASALVWLLQQSLNDETVATALQAIGGLPRDFSAFHILREAGTISLVLQRFQCCFHRDPTFDLQWHVIDPESAEKYCRAWVRLTHGTSERWPMNLQAPLDLLKNMGGKTHVSTIASCTSALDSLDSRDEQVALVAHLQDATKGDLTNFGELTHRWLLDTFLECSLSWELQAAVVEDIAKRAVPILLELLQRATVAGSPRSEACYIIGLTLYSLTVGSVDLSWLTDEETRRNGYHKTIIPSLAIIVKDPTRFGVKDDILDFAAIEFSRVSAPVIARSSRFPFAMKVIARQGLSQLYLDGRIGVGLIPDSVLADILQILHPLPQDMPAEQHPLLVKTLLKTITTSPDFSVDMNAIRLLERLLTNCQPDIVIAFSEENGIAVLLRAAVAGETDSRRLQIDCIRTLCVFIRSSTNFSSSHLADALGPAHYPALEKQFDAIFQSDFFSTLIATINSRRWWLPEVAEIWLPSLLPLCQARPKETVWANVATTFKDFAEFHLGEDGSMRMIFDLEVMIRLTEQSCNI